MGAKKKNNGDGGEKKKEENSITVVLKIDMHCEGCASKIVKTVRGFDGVEAAKTEFGANKLTVVGKVEPSKVRELLAERFKKRVDLLSPLPNKKDDANKNDNNNNAKNDNKKKPNDDASTKNKPDDKKPKEKEPPVTTAVLKLRLHCQGCIGKIHKTVTKTKGFKDMAIDKQKELVTVIGSMDMKALAETLQDKLKRPVEIVPPKKEKDAGDKDSGKGDNGKKKGGGGGGGGGGGSGDGGGQADVARMMDEMSRMEQYMGQPAFGYGYGYGHGHGPAPGLGYGYPAGYLGENVHAPQMFSDENPNACSVM